MTTYGTETDIAYPDINTKVETIKTMHSGNIKTSFRRYSVRVKVLDKTEETAEYLKFSSLVDKKRKAGVLLYRHNDVTLLPTFTIEYPKSGYDEWYFIVTTHTEVLL